MAEESEEEREYENSVEDESGKKSFECDICEERFEDHDKKIEHQKMEHKNRVCSYCGKKVRSMPYKCNYCGERFCNSHRLPEKHECSGVEESESLKDYAERNKRKNSKSSDLSDKVLGKNIGSAENFTDKEASNEPTNESEKPSEEEKDNSTLQEVLPKIKTPFRYLRGFVGGLFSAAVLILSLPLKAVSKALSILFSRNFLFFVFLAFIGFGLFQGDSGDGQPIDEEKVESKVHDLINDERTQRGLNSLDYSQSLEEIADYHSKDMLNRGYMAHTSPNGETMEDRYQKFNYNCAVEKGNTIYKGAENIAQTYYMEEIDTSSGILYHENNTELAKGLVNQWMNSAGHRKNILRPYWNKEAIGIKVAENPNGDGQIVYATQNFC